MGVMRSSIIMKKDPLGGEDDVCFKCISVSLIWVCSGDTPICRRNNKSHKCRIFFKTYQMLHIMSRDKVFQYLLCSDATVLQILVDYCFHHSFTQTQLYTDIRTHKPSTVCIHFILSSNGVIADHNDYPGLFRSEVENHSFRNHLYHMFTAIRHKQYLPYSISFVTIRQYMSLTVALLSTVKF
ncbi:hypothetical protein NPIL_93521 [Nephila pilipes]|uniref:Uncharacterized protein n=1 Tax=Nephila pilipes TaxID=299642 RepID=A0A8X6QER7_NEPPI|nr:hypothetical protein NPIL_93521 [Nephila pilipes]